MVWFSDSSGRQHVIAFEGYSSTDDPDGATINDLRFRLEPGAMNAAGPFVEVDRGRDGAIVVLDPSCNVIQRFPVSAGDYKVEIGAEGTVDLTEYGFGGRPSDYPEMAQTTDCA